MPEVLSPDLLQNMHAYWQAANYLTVGQITRVPIPCSNSR